MTAAARKNAPAPSALDKFVARCEAYARRCASGDLNLPDAIDALQNYATAFGLIVDPGQDAVQAIMAAAFARVRGDLLISEPISANFAEDAWNAPGWREAAIEYHRNRGGGVAVVEIEPERLARLRALMADGVSLERAAREINAAHMRGRAADFTVEALMFALRERGTAAMHEAEIRHRLAQLSEAQLIEVGDRLQRFKACAWLPEEIGALVSAWEAAHG
jgi:hypothetical protein